MILDQEIIEALYRVFTKSPASHAAKASRLRVAVRWLLRSWQNTPSMTWEDRLVFLKVASEALTAENGKSASAKKLEALFERATNQEGGSVGLDGLLWRPGQPPVVRTWTTRSGGQRSESVSLFVHWLGALGDSRNALVHGEESAALDYHQNGSQYDGPFVEIGDRVIREAILVTLGECGYPAVWRRGLARASFKLFKTCRLYRKMARRPSGG